jgi:hypothetical protein
MDLHTQQTTTARTKSSLFTGHCLATAPQLPCPVASVLAGWRLSHNCSSWPEGPSYIAPAWAAQKMPLPTVPPLLCMCPLPRDCSGIVESLHSWCLAMDASAEPFPSNNCLFSLRTCHIAPSLRVFVRSSLQVCHFLLLLRGHACNTFRLGGDQFFRNVPSPIVRSLMGNPTSCFTTSSPKVCPRALLNGFSLPRRSRGFMPRSFISFLPSGRVHHLFSNVRPSAFLIQHCPWAAVSSVCGALRLDAGPQIGPQLPLSSPCPLHRDFLLLLGGLHYGWTCLPLLQTGLRLISAGLRPF